MIHQYDWNNIWKVVWVEDENVTSFTRLTKTNELSSARFHLCLILLYWGQGSFFNSHYVFLGLLEHEAYFYNSIFPNAFHDNEINGEYSGLSAKCSNGNWQIFWWSNTREVMVRSFKLSHKQEGIVMRRGSQLDLVRSLLLSYEEPTD